jgi:hypothetical protein
VYFLQLYRYLWVLWLSQRLSHDSTVFEGPGTSFSLLFRRIFGLFVGVRSAGCPWRPSRHLWASQGTLWVCFRAPSGRLWVILGLLWDPFGVSAGPCWLISGPLGLPWCARGAFGPPRVTLGVLLGCFWDAFGSPLGSLWGLLRPFWLTLGTLRFVIF